MAKEYDNTNSGVLFVNNRQRNDRDPDYTGKLDVNGEQFHISGWKKKSKKSGNTFLSLSIRPQEDYSQAPPKSPEEEAPF